MITKEHLENSMNFLAMAADKYPCEQSSMQDDEQLAARMLAALARSGSRFLCYWLEKPSWQSPLKNYLVIWSKGEDTVRVVRRDSKGE